MTTTGKLVCAGGAVLVSLAAVAGYGDSQSSQERAIITTALDYGQGWYTGDAERMERAIHPDLAKRVRLERGGNAEGSIHHMSAMTLVQMTRRSGGTKVPKETQKTDVRILDVFGDAACVRLDMHDWIDYLHMSRIGDRWRIVNVLWELTPEAKEKSKSQGGH